jgi:hypothetical protein
MCQHYDGQDMRKRRRAPPLPHLALLPCGSRHSSLGEVHQLWMKPWHPAPYISLACGTSPCMQSARQRHGVGRLHCNLQASNRSSNMPMCMQAAGLQPRGWGCHLMLL